MPNRQDRARIAARLSAEFGGVAHRRGLRAAGIDRATIRLECAAGRWQVVGRHTVVLEGSTPTARGRLWQAVWESGAGAVLDGFAALSVAGLTGIELPAIDVTIRSNNRAHRVPGVRLHRRRHIGATMPAGIPRVRPEVAAIRAAQWAATDRLAALAICMPVQQRLVPADRLAAVWAQVQRSPRRTLLIVLIGDVVDGAHSLAELDFAALCRRHGLPAPTRQALRAFGDSVPYLDVSWDDLGWAVEIDGSQHGVGANPVDDALRQNEVSLGETRMLRIPLLGLRLYPDAFMAQVLRAHQQSRPDAA